MKKLLLVIFLISVNTQALAGVSLWGMKADIWSKNSKFENFVSVQGLFDAFVFSEYTVNGTKLNLDISVEQYRDAIDKLYSDYKNSLIPVPFLLRIVTLEINGEGKETIESELQIYRKMFADKNA